MSTGLKEARTAETKDVVEVKQEQHTSSVARFHPMTEDWRRILLKVACTAFVQALHPEKLPFSVAVEQERNSVTAVSGMPNVENDVDVEKMLEETPCAYFYEITISPSDWVVTVQRHVPMTGSESELAYMFGLGNTNNLMVWLHRLG
jgi:hypothetical protein